MRIIYEIIFRVLMAAPFGLLAFAIAKTSLDTGYFEYAALWVTAALLPFFYILCRGYDNT